MQGMMDGMTGDGVMWGMGIFWLLILWCWRSAPQR